MKNIIKITLILLVFAGVSSCEKVFFKPANSTDPVAIFEEYWNNINEKYAFFEIKEVDWQDVYDQYRPFVNENTTDTELFDVLAAMAARLRDGHVSISNPQNGDEYSYDGYVNGFPLNVDNNVILNNYVWWNFNTIPELNNNIWWEPFQDQPIWYGEVQQNRIGYIRCNSFNLEASASDFEQMIQALEGFRGIIIDLRSNGGGNPRVAVEMASFFVDQPTAAGYERFKVGPGPDDFSEDINLTLQPAENINYTKPIALLTNRGCFSATTLFIQHLSGRPNTFIIGDQTGGGGGSVSDGILANGWTYSLSVSQLFDANNVNVEAGVIPDIEASLTNANIQNNIDPIIEAALDALN